LAAKALRALGWAFHVQVRASMAVRVVLVEGCACNTALTYCARST
jgi:hypothetical protein